MAVNPKKLIHHSHTFPVGDDTVTVNFRRPSIAQLDEIRAALKSAGKINDDGTSKADTFAAQVETHLFPLIQSWDMVQDKLDGEGNPVIGADGEPETEPFPVTLENLIDNVPSEITMEMLGGINLIQAKERDAGNAPSTP